MAENLSQLMFYFIFSTFTFSTLLSKKETIEGGKLVGVEKEAAHKSNGSAKLTMHEIILNATFTLTHVLFLLSFTHTHTHSHTHSHTHTNTRNKHVQRQFKHTSG